MHQVKQRYEESVPVDRLRPHPLNANEGARAVIAESIEENGFYGAVYAHEDTGYIIAGNHRWDEAKKAGAETLPVIWLDVDEARAGKLLAVDNRSARLGSDDNTRLAALLESFNGDFVGTGYGMEDLDSLLRELGDGSRPDGNTDPDEVGPVPPKPQTQVGDLWFCGDHRLLCGDSRTELGRLLDGQQAQMVWTDPPYGVDYEGKTEERLTIEGDTQGGLEGLLRAVLPASLAVCAPGAPWFVAAPPGPLVATFMDVVGGLNVWRQNLVWVKDQFVLGHSDFHYRHEFVLYGWVPGAHTTQSDRTLDSVWEIPRPKRSEDHPTMKPVELVARALRTTSALGARILDPFGGSGSTMIAAEQESRVAYLCEVDPRYVDVAARRFQEFTGTLPVLERTGEAHDFTS